MIILQSKPRKDFFCDRSLRHKFPNLLSLSFHLVYDISGGSGDRNCVVLNDIHIDIMDYIVPASCTDTEFRQMWAEFEWENKVLCCVYHRSGRVVLHIQSRVEFETNS